MDQTMGLIPKICGLNKPYSGYAMNCKNNSHIIQNKKDKKTLIIL